MLKKMEPLQSQPVLYVGVGELANDNFRKKLHKLKNWDLLLVKSFRQGTTNKFSLLLVNHMLCYKRQGKLCSLQQICHVVQLVGLSHTEWWVLGVL